MVPTRAPGRALVLLFPALLLACHVTERLVLPDTGGARTMVLVVRGQERSLVHVIDLRSPVWPVFSAEGDIEIHAALFRASPAYLGVAPGLQPSDPSGESEARRPPFTVFRSIVREGAQSDWTETGSAAVAPFLDALPFDRARACEARRAVLQPESMVLAGADFYFALALDDDFALVGLRDGSLRRIGREGTSEDVTDRLFPRDPGNRLAGGYQDAEGILWLADTSGAIHRGTLDGGISVAPEHLARDPGDEVYLAGPPAGEPFELFALSDAEHPETGQGGASLERLGATGFEVLSETTEDHRNRSIAWAAPGEVVAVGAAVDASEIVHYRDGGIFRLVPPSSCSLGMEPVVVEHVPGSGTMLGTHPCAEIFRLEGERLVALPGSPLANWVQAFAPLDRGFLVGGSTDVVQHDPLCGFFDPIQIASDIQRIIRLGRTYAVVDQSEGDEQGTDIVFLRRRDDADDQE